VTEHPAEPQANAVHIDAQPGHVRIAIDGTPLPPGTVTGHTRQPHGVAFDGLARVAVGVTRTPGELVAQFLAEVDPVLLDQEALNRADYGGGPGATARAMLATLTEWATSGKGAV
jgi:hypothetical protein